MNQEKVICIELTQPCHVNGQSARYQSVWFLARLYYAACWGAGSVYAAEIQAHFTANKSIRMLISRVFADFNNWQIAIGWGSNKTANIATLNPARRSRGPFWLPAATMQLVDFLIHGQSVTQEQLADWLGISMFDNQAINKQQNSFDYLMQDMDFWQQMTIAMRDEHDGFSKQHTRQVAMSFNLARHYAHNDFQQALALMKESLAWRRNAQLDDSHVTLSQLDQLVDMGSLRTAQPTFSAMAYIIRAWRHYVRGDIETTHQVLKQLDTITDLSLVIRYNPKIRFEYLNLNALLQKYQAVSISDMPINKRMYAAKTALHMFIEALEAAYEADAIDAVQHVAANIGWCLWLFWQQRLLEHPYDLDIVSIQRQAMRWIGLSEWICDRFSVANSSTWNIIFLLRIARGNCPGLYQCTLKQFCQHTPFSIAETCKILHPLQTTFFPAKGFTSWSAVALFTLEEADHERMPSTPLQLANLLLEAIWFLVLEQQGITPDTCQLMSRLMTQLRLLQRSEQSFFNEQLATMPAELQMQ